MSIPLWSLAPLAFWLVVVVTTALVLWSLAALAVWLWVLVEAVSGCILTTKGLVVEVILLEVYILGD